MNLNAIKKAAKMFGIDFSAMAKEAVPTINEALTKLLDEVECSTHESKGFILLPNSNGSFVVIKARFKQEANTQIENLGHKQLENIIFNLVNQFNNE